MSTSTKRTKSSQARRPGVGLDQELAGLNQDELSSIVAEDSIDETAALSAGGEEPAPAPVSIAEKRSRAKVVPTLEVPAMAALAESADMAPSNPVVRLFSLGWFLFSSIFVYLYQIFARAGKGLQTFGRYALRVSSAPSKFETGKTLFWLAVAGGLLALFFSRYPGNVIYEEISMVTSETQKIIVDERAVKELRSEMEVQMRILADEVGMLKASAKAADDKSSQMFELIQKLSDASDEMGKWVKAAGSETDQKSGTNQVAMQALQDQASNLARQIAELSTLESRQNATLENALAELEKKLVAMQDERDSKLRAEIKRVEQHFLTVVGTQDGKVQTIEPDESKIREIAESVMKGLSQKLTDDVSSSALAAVSDENIRRLVRQTISSDSALLKDLYDKHIKAHVNQEATKTAAEVASHLIQEAANTIAPDTKTGDGEKAETREGTQQQNVQPNYVSFSKDEVVRVVSEQLEKFIVGGVAMPDYALKKAGASVVPHMTQARHFPISSDASAFKRLVASVLPPAPRSGPEEALKPVVSASDCWPFYGGSANMTVELACPVKPTFVTIDHIHPSLTPHPESAPKSFKVWAISSVTGPNQRKHLLGEYTYDINTKNPIQSFPVQYPVQSWTPYVTLEVDDNWGHWYTCLYRFRVHGEPSDVCKTKI